MSTNKYYIIFRDGVPYELISGEYEFRMGRLEMWRSFFSESTFSISEDGVDAIEQCEY